MSPLAEFVEGTCNAHQLAGAVICGVGYDRLVIVRKVKDQPRLNIGNVVRYSRNDGHDVMRIMGRRYLALYTYCWGGACCDCDDNGAAPALSARYDEPDHGARESTCNMSEAGLYLEQ